MCAIGAQRQRPDPDGKRCRQLGIKMRKQVPAPRRLPFQVRAESVRIKGCKQQAVLTGEMLGRRFTRLIRRGEMDIAVGQIHRGALEDAKRNSFLPEVFGHNLENQSDADLVLEVGMGRPVTPPDPGGADPIAWRAAEQAWATVLSALTGIFTRKIIMTQYIPDAAALTMNKPTGDRIGTA